MSAIGGLILLNTINQIHRHQRNGYDYGNDGYSSRRSREHREQLESDRIERERESFKENIGIYSKAVKDITDKVEGGDLSTPEKDSLNLTLNINRATEHYRKAYGYNHNLATSEILNKGLNDADTPFTEQTFADVEDALFVAIAQKKFEEIEQDPTHTLGRLGWLNHSINEYKGQNEDLKALETPYERLYFTPDENYYYLHGDYNSNWESTLGITKDQYYNAALQIQNQGIGEYISFFKENRYEDSIVSADVLEHLDRYINHTADMMHHMDSEMSPKEYRQLILSNHDISDEQLSAWLKQSVVNDINNRLDAWNKHSFECEYAADFNDASASNELAHTLMSKTADKIGLSIRMENEEEIRSMGIDFDALKGFNTRHEQLQLSEKYPGTANTLEWLGIRDAGCKAQHVAP